MKVLILDNYDSFTFNLYQYIGEILEDSKAEFSIAVYRNDKITLKDIQKEAYDRIIISPGPGDPRDNAYFGVCAQVLLTIGKTTPILGVCLGMQGMAYYFGGTIKQAHVPMHGKTSIISHDGKGIFHNVPQEIAVMRYHSLIADENNIAPDLEVTSRVINTQEIMGLRHKQFPIEGIQFHPESFATDGGKLLLQNFLFQVT